MVGKATGAAAVNTATAAATTIGMRRSRIRPDTAPRLKKTSR